MRIPNTPVLATNGFILDHYYYTGTEKNISCPQAGGGGGTPRSTNVYE